MGSPLSSVWKFLNYWYFRYLMVTELYMVEKWEQYFTNTAFVFIICMVSFINFKILCFTGAIMPLSRDEPRHFNVAPT